MILVTGISGVGKTHTIELFVRLHPEFHYARASLLLRELGRPTTDLSRQQILNNQIALRAEVKSLSQRYGKRLIVDGHAVLESAQAGTVAIDNLFQDMPISIIILIEDEPLLLAERRKTKGRIYTASEIIDILNKERQASLAWAEATGVRLRIVRSGDTDDFGRALIS